MNRVILMGNLGRDPEARDANGKKVVTFSLATNEGKDRVEWHRIVAWEKTAELVEKYMTKGSKALIEGRLQTRKWEKDGVERQTTEIVAQRVEFADGKKKEESSSDGTDFAAPF